MINSRNLSDLRPDVKKNCEKLLARCEKLGLHVLITQTLRDNEYQAKLYAQGRTAPGSIVTNAKTTSFHGRGLAFDFCKNVKGHEYDDPAFFEQVSSLAKEMGFSWGGDWKSFPDRPHIQWDDNKRYTDAMVRSGTLPPRMPECEEPMTQAEFNKMMDAYLAARGNLNAEFWAVDELAEAVEAGITDGTRPQAFATRQEVALMVKRAVKK